MRTLPARKTLFVLTAALSVAAFGMPQVQQGTLGQFSNIADRAGINVKHENGATPEKYLPETMGGGALLLDYNNDGWLDVFLVNGGSFKDSGRAARARHRLYRNLGKGAYTDVTPSSGIEPFGFGMGSCAADYDNDGWVDLYITGVPENRLYHNGPGGTFTDVTKSAGIGAAAWSASCAFGDIDNDGHLDLYVTRYVDFTVENNKFCDAAEIP